MTKDKKMQNVKSLRKALLLGGALIVAPFGVMSAGAAELDQKPPEMSPEAKPVPIEQDEMFRPDPEYGEKEYNAEDQFVIYGAKQAVDTPRPLVELGRSIYTEGPFQPGINVVGEKNLLFPGLSVYGDIKSVVAYADGGNVEKGQVAVQLNLDIDFKLTATERIHAFIQPLDKGGKFTRYEFFGDDDDNGDGAVNGNIETLFFEGDMGAIQTGLTGVDADYDLPFAFGFTPFLFQNGIWVDDAFIGGGFSVVAKNSPKLDISNMDVTVFAGFTEVNTPAIVKDGGGLEDNELSIYGIAAFIEASEGYYEVGLGRIHGRDEFRDQSYNSLTAAFTKRYGDLVSNSIRGVWTFGQERDNNAEQTADGFALLIENSFITHKPSTLVPYANAFIGFDKPQPLADDTGLLKNTGINFEADGLSGFPALDDSANDTWGGAVGVEYLFNLDQQIVVEAAFLQAIGGEKAQGRNAKDDQYAVGMRYQLPLNATWIFRSDAMYGWRSADDDISGLRLEMRRKF